MIKGDVEGNWNVLLGLLDKLLHSEDAKLHRQILMWFKNDWLAPAGSKETLLGFQRAPAAKRNHHAFEGGLVFHILEMWEIWLRLKTLGAITDPVHINDARVLKGIIYHDFHKGCTTFVLESENPWKVKYREGEDDNLLPHDIKTLSILSGHGITLDDEQLNALMWAEGGFSETKPKWRSMLAVLLYCLDEFSGNFLGRLERKAFLDVSHQSPF